MTNITIIIPTLNEEDGIGKTIESIPSGKLRNYEILIVDGNSKDKTVEISKKLGARVINEKRKGYGRAYKTGFENAKGDILITLDGDSTYPAKEIPKLIKLIKEKNLEFITTNRFANMEEGAMSFRNKLGNKILSITCKLLFKTPFNDSQSGMWVLKKESWKKLEKYVKNDGMSFSQEIKIEAFRRLKSLEVPIIYKIRKGKPKLNAWKDGLENLFALFSKRLRK